MLKIFGNDAARKATKIFIIVELISNIVEEKTTKRRVILKGVFKTSHPRRPKGF